MLSIENDGNKEGRFDSTNFSEGFSFRKFGAIELLRCCVIHCDKHGRFDSTKFCEGLSLENLVLSNRCAAVLSMAVREHQSF